MRVLVTWGSKRGGTEGIGRTIAAALHAEGVDVDARPAQQALNATGFDAVIVGGALYASRFHAAARRFVRKREQDLRRVPVWFFSSGPLDDSSDRAEVAPTLEAQMLMDRVGALGHATFGGRLSRQARGFPASVMAVERSGDWRNEERIRSWATQIARALPTAQPGHAIDLPGGSIARLLAHAAVGWALCAGALAMLLQVAPGRVALGIHTLLAPVLFAFLARNYFGARGAHEVLTTAWVWAATVAALDLVLVAGLWQRSLAMFGSVLGTWLPLALIFLSTWVVGAWGWVQPRATHAPRARAET
jgi:menaquinone-dependent protoporphyrinogen oxidase